MTTSASAQMVCQQTYIKTWSNYYGNWVIQPGQEQCYDNVPQQYAPAPVYAEPGPVYNDGVADVLIGGLIGAGIGYAIGNNNNNGNKKNYYYYNGGHKNWHGNKHKKRYAYPGGWNNGEGRKQPKNYKKPVSND
jgi:hypothetical protein